MRCQSKVNCSSQVCWRTSEFARLWLQKEEEDDEFDGCLGCENDKIYKYVHVFRLQEYYKTNLNLICVVNLPRLL